MVKFGSFIGVACAAIAIANASPAVAQEGETVTKNFEQARETPLDFSCKRSMCGGDGQTD